MKLVPTALLLVCTVFAAGCERSRSSPQPPEADPVGARAGSGASRQDKSKIFEKRIGDRVFIHLAWFHDPEVAGEVLSRLEEEGLLALGEGNLGVITVMIAKEDGTEGLHILESNPAWMAARVRGKTGYRATIPVGKSSEGPE